MREEAVTEVTERAAVVMGEEAVLAVPALAVPRVEGVDVDVAAVAVERSAVAGRLEAVDADAVVGEPPEHVPVLAVGPVLEDVELCERAAPVREVQLLVSTGAAEVLLEPHPGLQRPVAPVGSLAGRDGPGERRPVIGKAGSAPALSVADLELDLRPRGARRERVDRAPGGQHLLAAGAVVGHVRASLLVDGQARPRDVPPDDRAAEGGRSGDGCDEQH